MKWVECDVVIVGSGAGGGTVAEALGASCGPDRRVLLLEKGARLADEELTGREVEMARALYEQGGGVLTAERTLSLAMGSTFGGSTAVYTGTSLRPAARVLRAWDVPGISPEDLVPRCARFEEDNGVHLLPEDELNDNNRLFRLGAERLGWHAEQFPVNTRRCRGSGLCNLGCANGGKQGTNRVQLPRAERDGVEVVTRCEALRVEALGGRLVVRAVVRERPPDAPGEPPEWEPGEYAISARAVVSCAGAVGSPALLLRSGLGAGLTRLGQGFTCQPAVIVVAEHERPLTNTVGHPKSFYVDRAATEGWLLEACMYFPFTTARSVTGFGPEHEGRWGSRRSRSRTTARSSASSRTRARSPPAAGPSWWTWRSTHRVRRSSPAASWRRTGAACPGRSACAPSHGSSDASSGRRRARGRRT